MASFLSEIDGKGGKATNDDEHGGITLTLGGPFGNLTFGDEASAHAWAVSDIGVGSSLRSEHEHAT